MKKEKKRWNKEGEYRTTLRKITNKKWRGGKWKEGIMKEERGGDRKGINDGWRDRFIFRDEKRDENEK